MGAVRALLRRVVEAERASWMSIEGESGDPVPSPAPRYVDLRLVGRR